ncbi:TLDc domain-containing protein [Entamoeba marina]
MNYLKHLTNESCLKEWSNLNEFTLLFDSDIHGFVNNKEFSSYLLNKKNLYIINFDEDGNVFGGYVNSRITDSRSFITDENAFVFSLLRNGVVKNSKYNIIPSSKNESFALVGSLGFYVFGKIDIAVKQLGDNAAFCKQASFNYNGEEFPFTDHQFPNTFKLLRIVVVEMN